MTTIRKIFLTDLKHIVTNFFALVIIIGVGVLPSLYAWFNIYSNWDPYGSTGNLKMAAISLDEGWTDDDGEYQNAGDAVIEKLKDNESINWQFVSSEDEAIEGVKNGTYYGAVVVPADFTYSMHNVFIDENVDRPSLCFYQNQKKNPIATKISDTVVETLQGGLEEAFVNVMVATVFSGTNDLMSDIEGEDGIEGLKKKIDAINQEINTYETVIDQVIISNAQLSDSLTSATGEVDELKGKTDNSAAAIANANGAIEASQTTLNAYTATVNATMDTVKNGINDVNAVVNDATLKQDVETMQKATDTALTDAQGIRTDLIKLQTSVATSVVADPALVSTIDKMVNTTDTLVTTLEVAAAKNAEATVSQDVESAKAALTVGLNQAVASAQGLQNQFNNDLTPQMNQTLDSLQTVLSNAETLMGNLSSTLTGMKEVFLALQVTVGSADTSLESTRNALALLSERLTEISDRIEMASDDERVQVLLDTLTGDPEAYGEFFSKPVQIETTVIYPVDNYGSAVSPFYTTLAIWVGALILTAIIKVKPNEGAYPDAKPYQLYFGRYLIFFVVGQLQTLITVLGDIYLLHIQCKEPLLFYLASAFTSLVFSILIYSLVLAFGDVGKALAVVIVVLQIAGSSGTFPIELLPEFFRNVYIFFPFPYAINAMRECIGGLYESDYTFYLLELSAFIVVSLVIGLFIQRPFAGLSEFMEKRMEDTEMM